MGVVPARVTMVSSGHEAYDPHLMLEASEDFKANDHGGSVTFPVRR